jgi:hypothetical protein
MVAAFSPKGFSNKAFQAITRQNVAATISVIVKSAAESAVTAGLTSQATVKSTGRSMLVGVTTFGARITSAVSARAGSTGTTTLRGLSAIAVAVQNNLTVATNLFSQTATGIQAQAGVTVVATLTAKLTTMVKAAAAPNGALSIAATATIRTFATLNAPGAVALVARAAVALFTGAAATVLTSLTGRSTGSVMAAAAAPNSVVSLAGRTLSIVSAFLKRLVRNPIVSILVDVEGGSLGIEPVAGTLGIVPAVGSVGIVVQSSLVNCTAFGGAIVVEAKSMGSITVEVAQMAVRGTKVTFTGTCLDKDGNPVTPDTATLYLVYVAPGDETKHSIDIVMTITGNVVTATWDTSVSDVKPVRWSVRTTGADAVAQDGTLTITGNEANPDPP